MSTIAEEKKIAERKAFESLAKYKFAMFGYWAGIWVHLNRIDEHHDPNPFAPLVSKSRQIIKDYRPSSADADYNIGIYLDQGT